MTSLAFLTRATSSGRGSWSKNCVNESTIATKQASKELGHETAIRKGGEREKKKGKGD